MAAFTTVFDEASDPRNRDFYMPTFEIKIDGAGLPRGVLRDVTELSYQDDVTQIDNFQITVNNWDATARRCKYIGSETADQLTQSNRDSLLFKLFEPCNKTVKLSLGYVDNLSPIMTGNFTTMEPNFPNSGPPVLTVRGLNILHRLRTKKFTTAWTKLTPSAIARNFNSLRDKGAPRLKPPWQVITDSTAEGLETPIEYMAQTDQYDVDFLLNLARTWSYELEVIEDQHQLRFGPGRTASKFVNYRLDWGKSLIEFTPTLSTANQWKSVTVRGWDRRSQKPISEPIDLDDPQLKKLNANLHEMLQQCDPREQQVVDLPVFTRAEAKDRARAMLRDRLVQIVKAKGRTVGLPGLRAGTLVDIEQVGARLSGIYFVTKTTHTIGSGGYTTEFECRREDLGSQPRPGGT
jgi:phage protein D